MLPVVAGPRETKRQMLIYTLVLLPVALVPTLMGAVGWLYGAVALALGLAFIGHAVTVWRAADDASGHGAGPPHVPLLADLSRRAVRRAAGRPARVPDAGRMSVMADNRPGDSDMHRRQRGKNLVVAGFLLALAVIFFALTIVRMGPQP